MPDDSTGAATGIGAPVPRIEDERFLTGRGRFVDDIKLGGMAFGCVVRSPHAHARIRSIDATAALAMPGVLLVLTGEDAARDGLGGVPCISFPRESKRANPNIPNHPVLVKDTARHVGDRVAFVVAETKEQAKDAAEAVAVDYGPLPAVPTLEAALADGAPAVWLEAQDNLWFELERGDRAAVDAAFAKAAHVTRYETHYPRAAHCALEPRSTIGEYDAAQRRYTLYIESQTPHRAREVIAGLILRIPETDLRVISPDVGGGFGSKGGTYSEDALVLWAAAKLDRPVKWTADRSEALLSDSQGRDQLDAAELALDEDGRVLAMRATATLNVGAYLHAAAGIPCGITATTFTTVYDLKLLHCTVRGAFTHTNSIGPFRGTGRPEATNVMERLIDKAAREMGIDPVEIRRRNMIAPEEMPYETPGGHVYDAGDFGLALNKALEVADWQGFAARRAESEKRRRRRGAGICMHVESAGLLNERMEIRVDPGGSVALMVGTLATGQGHETMYTQMASDWLGLPYERIRVLQGDTDRVLFGRGTFAERSAMTGGAALFRAAEDVIRKGKRVAGVMLEAAEDDIAFEQGMFRVAGTDRAVPFAAVARMAHAPVGLPPDFGMGLDGVGSDDGKYTYPNGCMICEVEVDPATGVFTIERFTAVDDVGVVLNPLMLHGQVHGSIGQGVGQAIGEAVIYDADGQLITGSFLDYCMPRADNFPSFDEALIFTPTEINILGVKGGSEPGNIAAPPAVINALIDALAPIGVDHLEMPATPERVWRAIRTAETNTV